MKRLPTRAEAKAHAKYLSRILNISLSHAQDVVALRYNYHNWSALSVDFGQFTEKYVSFYGLATPEEIAIFRQILTPYITELQSTVDPARHIPESLLCKVADGHLSRVSGKIMSSVIRECEEYPPSGVNDILDLLMFYDDSASRVVEKYHRQVAVNNPWLEPWVFGLRFYAYYHFDGNTVTILSREWDLDIHDTNHHGTHDRAFSRPWYPRYMIGYLAFLAKQFIRLGYDGSIKICCVNNYAVRDYQRGQPAPRGYEGVPRLYRDLLDCGGESKWSTSHQGNPHDFGIKISFKTLVSSVKGRK